MRTQTARHKHHALLPRTLRSTKMANHRQTHWHFVTDPDVTLQQERKRQTIKHSVTVHKIPGKANQMS